jgi:integrase
MATITMATLWRDPRTGILMLRKRIPTRYRAVSGRKGETVKISTGTADRKAAEAKLPEVLKQWVALQAEWERKLNLVSLTPERAQEIAAQWAAWIASGARLDTDGEDSDVFEPLDLPECRTPERLARVWDRVEAHADEAMRQAGVEITPETWPLLVQAMVRVVQAAYLQADLEVIGVSGRAVQPLRAVREALPQVHHAPPPRSPDVAPAVSFAVLFEAWQSVTTVKPRTVEETRYMLSLLREFVGHDDAARLTRDDMARWRDASKANGRTNNTWNNRLSMLRQVFAHAVADGKLKANAADNSLRLRKNRTKSWHPYSDADAAAILKASRAECAPSIRWAHWIMAFTGMRVGEVLQMTGGDVRREGDIWFLAVHEDDAGKSVKTGQRRHTPVHPALIAEGFISYAQTIAPDAPLFPDKRLDKFGQRGGRGWNVVGKWVREKVGITDKRKGPDHSWRHRMEDELRAAEVPEDARDAIVGRSRKTTGRIYGVRGEALARLHRYLSRVPVPPGV